MQDFFSQDSSVDGEKETEKVIYYQFEKIK